MKIKFIKISDIKENELNNVFSMGNLNDLLDSIRTYGLKEPLSVCSQDDGSYKLISGHRRLTCIKQILAEGATSYQFMEKTLSDVVPCIEERDFGGDDDEEFLHLASSNKYRHLTPAENEALVKKCHEIYLRKLDSDPESVKGVKREVIAKMACVIPRTVDKYLKDENSTETKEKVMTSDSIVNTINKYKDFILAIDIDYYGRNDRNMIKDSLLELSAICKKKK